MTQDDSGSSQAPMSAQPARLRFIRDGPLQVKGPVELQDEDGVPIDLGGRRTLILCRCGNSKAKPFCDGSHLLVRRDNYPVSQATHATPTSPERN